VPHEDKGDALSCWRWLPKEESPETARGDGWVHEGDKPVFQESNRKWQLTSEKPDLSFRKDGKKVASKISTDESGRVAVAADSPAAESNVKRSRETARKKAKAEAGAKQSKQGNVPEPPGENRAVKSRTENASEQETEGAAKAGESSEQAAQEKKSGSANDRLPGAAQEEEAAKAAKAPAATDTNVVELKDRRGKEKSGQKKGLSPLDFLEQKKKQLKNKLETSFDETEAPPQEEEAEQVPEETAGPTAKEKTARKDPTPIDRERPERKKKSAADAAREALERLKSKAEEELPESSALEEAPPEEAEEEGPGPEEDEHLEREAKEKKARSTKGHSGREEKERQERDEKPPVAAAGAKAKRKKEVLGAIQDILKEPLPEKMEPEEEARLRKNLGLEHRPEIGPKELARKDRLKRVKELKARLEELDLEPSFEEEQPELRKHDLRADDPENSWSHQSAASEKRSSNLRAFDSDLEEKEKPERERKALPEADQGEIRTKDSDDERYLYLPEQELKPLGAAWDRAGDHFVFLAAEQRYRGAAEGLETILPLWIYRGEKVPELLDKTRQWRFSERLPLEAKTLDDIPQEVQDFLLGLGPKESGGAEEESAKDSVPPPESEESGESEESTSVVAEEESFSDERERKDSKRDLSALLSSLEDEEAALEARTAVEGPADEEDQKPSGQADTLEEIFTSAEKKKTEEGSQEELTPARERLSAPEPGQLSERLKEESPAFEKFLERRKNRKPTPPAEKSEDRKTSPFLGIFVTLSNSLGPMKDKNKAVGNVLKAIDNSFGSCTAALLSAGDPAKVRLSSGSPLEPGSTVDRSSGLSLEIRQGSGEAAPLIGYLFLLPAGERSGFAQEEREAAKRVVEAIWPILPEEEIGKESAA
jgi:hypothetical protein